MKRNHEFDYLFESREIVKEAGRSKYSEVCLYTKTQIFMYILQGVAPKSSKLSSVKKLLVLGAVADVPENYPNVKVILDQLNIEALQFTVAAVLQP